MEILTLTVFSERIIRVTFSGHDSLPGKKELVVTMNPGKVDWEVKTAKGNIVLQTGAICAKVDTSGTVRFYNKEGEPLLSELPGSRKLTPTLVQNEKAFSPEQSFSCGDEGLYGMGQFQDGLMNWKNVPLRLKQYNQEIMLPYLVSTKGYGLLWDNYSVTKFNPAENELYLTNVLDPKQNKRSTTFTPTQSGVYCFAVESVNPNENRIEGPVLLTIDGDTVIHYNTTWVPDFFSGKKELVAGQPYNIVLTNSNTPVPGKVLYNGPDYNKTVFQSRSGNMVDYYFVNGGDLVGVISSYRELTGQAPLFGKWAYGFWQCKDAYHLQAELLESAKEYRRRQIPVDNIVQNAGYYPLKTWGSEWDRSRFPDPNDMIRNLKDMNFHFMVSVWPILRNQGLEKKYDLGKDSKYNDFGFLAFYNPRVRESFYKMVKDSMYSLGVNSIWLDATEPELYPLNTKTVLGSYDNYALTYSLAVTRSVYEGHRKDFPDDRVFNLTRSGFCGQQRYAAACWSGDVKATWEQLSEQIPAGLNFCMAGLPYWTTDIGSYFRECNGYDLTLENQYTNPVFRELLSRWFEYGTFCPIFRIHGKQSNTEVWNYGKDFESLAREFINIRYQLMPYIYSLAWQVTDKGSIMMKPLVYDYPQDKNTWDIRDQFLFGSAIMVNPVINYKARSRNIYFSSGYWYNFWTGEKVSGGKSVTVSAPLNQEPIFIKSGSIIPVGPKVQFAMQDVKTPLKIFVYPGADGSFELYEDEGETYHYEQGAYSEILMNWDDQTRTLTLGERKGTFKGMLNKREFKVILMDGKNGKMLDQNDGVAISYKGTKQTVKL